MVKHKESVSIYGKKTRVGDSILYGLIYFCAFITVALLAGIIGYVIVNGIGEINLTFIFTQGSALNHTVGIAGNILNTIYIIVLTLLIAVPIGVGSAIYLNEYAKPGKLVDLINFTTETLSGIPSILFGLFGMMFFGRSLGLSYSILTGALTLSLMVLPLITRNTQDALSSVPDGYRSGALGMGATKWYMIRTILLPSAMPGIVTGVILAIGRIVGESAALLFTAGSDNLLPGLHLEDYLEKILESGGTLTIQMYLSMQKGEYASAFGIAVILLLIVCGINMLARYISRRFQPDKR